MTDAVAASFLQQHADCTFLLDAAAAAQLTAIQTPWIIGPVEWTPELVRRAVIWLSLKVSKGEIVGVAGMDGNGQRALAEAIAGQRRVTSGMVELFGVTVNRLSVSARQRLGLRYLTDDRLGEGIVGSLGVALNIFLKRIGERPFWRWGRIDRRRVNAEAGELVQAFDIRTPGLDTRAGTLSHGSAHSP